MDGMGLRASEYPQGQSEGYSQIVPALAALELYFQAIARRYDTAGKTDEEVLSEHPLVLLGGLRGVMMDVAAGQDVSAPVLKNLFESAGRIVGGSPAPEAVVAGYMVQNLAEQAGMKEVYLAAVPKPSV